MSVELIVSSLQKSARNGLFGNIEKHLPRATEQSLDAELDVRDRAVLNYEIAKSLRLIGRHAEAFALSEQVIANFPPGIFELLSSFFRLQALLRLDEGQFEAAEAAILKADAMQLNLQEGQSVSHRNELNVSCETWLVCAEISLAQGFFAECGDYVEKAKSRHTKDVAAFDDRQFPLLEARQMHKQQLSISKMIELYAAVLALQTNNFQTAQETMSGLLDFFDENNVVVSVKIRAALAPDFSNPLFFNSLEFARWRTFGSRTIIAGGRSPADTPVTELSPLPPAPELPVTSGKDEFVQELTNFLKNANTQNSNGSSPPHLSGRKADFSGHIHKFGLDAFLFNCFNQQFTGYIEFVWSPEYYESSVVVGSISDQALLGKAYLFISEGIVIDACVGQSEPSPNKTAARDNFWFIMKMCCSIGMGKLKPDIHANAVTAEKAAERPRRVELTHESLIPFTIAMETPPDVSETNVSPVVAGGSPGDDLLELL